MREDFSTWILAQLQDPKLKAKAKARMANAPKMSTSPLKVPSKRPPAEEQPSPPRFIHVAKPHKDGFWKEQLLREVPYQAAFSGSEQLKRQVDILFERAAEQAYALRLERLDRHHRSDALPSEKLPSYLLSKLRVLTEHIVCAHYRGREEKGYSDDAYLSFALGAEGKATLESFLRREAETLPPADEETLRYFGFDQKGRPILWWDPKGIIQDHYEVQTKTIRRLQERQASLSALWTIPPLVRRVVFLYDAAMDVLEEAARKQNVRWNNRMMREYLYDTACGRETINPYAYTILRNLLRLAEARVRIEIAGISPIQTARDRREVARRLPKGVEEEVVKAIETTPLPSITEEDFFLLPAEEKRANRIRQKWLFLLPEEEEQLTVLDTMNEKEVCAILGRRDNGEELSPAFMRLQRFFALRRKPNAARTSSAMQELVDSSHEEDLRQVLHSLSPENPHWVSKLSKQLTAWQSPKARTLRLNRRRIREAKIELTRTVAMVDHLLTTGKKEEIDDE